MNQGPDLCLLTGFWYTTDCSESEDYRYINIVTYCSDSKFNSPHDTFLYITHNESYGGRQLILKWK